MAALDKDISDLNTAFPAFITAKIGSTGKLTSLVNAANALPPSPQRETLIASVTAYVNQFDLMTAQTNAMHPIVAATVADSVAIAPPSEEDEGRIADAPLQYYVTAVAIALNIICSAAADEANALTAVGQLNDLMMGQVKATFAALAAGQNPALATPDRVIPLVKGTSLEALSAALLQFQMLT